MKSLIRRNKLALEKRYSVKLPLAHSAVTWLVIHSTFCHNRFFVGTDGKTPYMRVRGKPYDKPMVELGERVLYVKTNNMIGPRLNQAETRAEGGIFLGVRPLSNEIYVGTPGGIIKARTIHRVSIDNRWNLLLFESIRGVPWNHKAESPSELPAEQQLRPALQYDPYDDSNVDKPPPPESKEPNIQPRSFRICRSDLENGLVYTPGCKGCEALALKRQQRPHTSECRSRIQVELLKSASGRARVELAARRMQHGPQERGAEPQEPPELEDEDRADLDIPAAGEEVVYSPTSPASEDGDAGEDDMNLGFCDFSKNAYLVT